RKPDSIIEREETTPDAPDAKPAVTTYRVLAKNTEETHSVVLASPITGRTHQIRVQFAGIGCPVTGDSLYGTGSPYILRHALHSWKTEFPHPMSGERITVTAPVPEDIHFLMAVLGLSDFRE
ncbi:MAG: RluA family pseudouridine synthase, partial [Clostridia bacterium]|nr:RluA family pseudouridine synthase [Clostridia bacterium]